MCIRDRTNRADAKAISKVNRLSVELGTAVEYAGLHQEGGTQLKWRNQGTTEIKARPPVSIGSPERAARWRQYARDFISSVDLREVKNA